ncbi:glycosyltransferase family 4 protein [Microbacterium sp. 4R-513]|uniref:glycosyltransferase family 4 protein n=1 Tax=Microbacterium sp. 4R-513 TaxID=2567934 RepID=UPI0013E0F218|nr:glycosyltransferase family 4 protein [Microbacterium sp. 4R-513]QIG39576.1 glycosyltransferase family 4 protein [Microbacterium sp. 4R-513]
MSPARTVHFVVPEGVDDPARVSGGNVFDLRVAEALAALGWDVRLTPVTAGVSPAARIVDEPSEAPAVVVPSAASVLPALDDGAVVLVDGLVAGRSAGVIEAECRRLRVVVLAHMVSDEFPDAEAAVVEGERRAFAAASRIVTASEWLRRRIVDSGLADPVAVVAAPPGVEPAPAAEGSANGASLLCVGVVAPHKGQDVLVDALTSLDTDLEWACTIAGAVDVEPAFVQKIEHRASAEGIDGRISFPGVLAGRALDRAYGRADLVVAPSRVESYGMAVADALGRGIPVLASDVGGIPEAARGSSAAILVPPGDTAALGEALGRWIADPALRARLTARARSERGRGRRWSDTAARIAEALEGAP